MGRLPAGARVGLKLKSRHSARRIPQPRVETAAAWPQERRGATQGGHRCGSSASEVVA
jgi:hypothetical protein